MEFDTANLTLTTDVRQSRAVREDFFRLATDTFGLDFRPWYDAGCWGDDYQPYALTDGDRVAANVSVNRMTFRRRDRLGHYIQLGTVMTDRACRGRGLSRFLMERVLEDWRGRCDGIYLFANDDVLDFYPKFGFKKAEEFQYSIPVRPGPGKARRLDMTSVGGRAVLLDRYAQGNPFSAMQAVENIGLLLFYCLQVLKDCVYLLEDSGVVAVAEREGGRLLCHDIFGRTSAGLEDILTALAPSGVRTAALGFTPNTPAGFVVTPYREEGTTLFLLGKNPLDGGMFPLLTHA